jgi:hypothetical protein
MGIKEMSLVVVFLIGIQMLVVAIITNKNKQVFNSLTATSYAKAVSNLAKTKPIAANMIRFCYLACLIELLILVFIKFVKYG